MSFSTYVKSDMLICDVNRRFELIHGSCIQDRPMSQNELPDFTENSRFEIAGAIQI